MTEITEEMVETVARALCRNKYLAGHAADAVEWLVDRDWRGYASDARAALTAAFASRPSQGGEWVMAEAIIDHYYDMLPGDVAMPARCEPEPGTTAAHIKWMLNQIGTMRDQSKAMRWLGFIQGILIERGYTTVTREREFTRPYFSASPSPYGVEARPTGHFCIVHDGFAGDVIGHYTTREGKPGVVLQQDGTRVVHVYGEKWLTKDQSNG
ncbi:hypothetical protein [Devosia ginsengisoli]|uniref:Uncharacterized protein n=1 Tax=Devosia ginsengisoli TaxID=400770 RepID=A0A5B8LSD3_9HYPH|nr:hypothetical protein [Devosia ginsengisoli]QDZ10564.1 hypothetical protein FPZ08_07245 [Devosia ginsengisoli]